MKIAHLILAHQNPSQLAKLVDRITHPDADIFIHLDKNGNTVDFTKFLSSKDRVYFIEDRIKIRWGSFSMVEATIRSFSEIILKDRNYSFINLLSASDYPLKSPASIHAFLADNVDKTFMEFHTSGSAWWNEAQQKVKKHHLIDYNFRGKYAVEKLINKVITNREIPMGMELVGRSQWFTMSVAHAKYILGFVEAHPKFVRFFKHTWGPDEFFFHTILYNSPFKEHIVNDNLRYIDWSENKKSPKILTSVDFDALSQSGKFYARKFDEAIDASILDQIDQLI